MLTGRHNLPCLSTQAGLTLVLSRCSGTKGSHSIVQLLLAGTVQTKIVQMAGIQGNPADFFQHPAPLGSNLYDRGRIRALPPEGRQIGVGGQLMSLPSMSTPTEPDPPKKVGTN